MQEEALHRFNNEHMEKMMKEALNSRFVPMAVAELFIFIAQVFKTLDTKGDGVIDEGELTNYLIKLGHRPRKVLSKLCEAAPTLTLALAYLERGLKHDLGARRVPDRHHRVG